MYLGKKAWTADCEKISSVTWILVRGWNLNFKVQSFAHGFLFQKLNLLEICLPLNSEIFFQIKNAGFKLKPMFHVSSTHILLTGILEFCNVTFLRNLKLLCHFGTIYPFYIPKFSATKSFIILCVSQHQNFLSFLYLSWWRWRKHAEWHLRHGTCQLTKLDTCQTWTLDDYTSYILF